MANVEQPQFTNTLASGSPPLERQRTNSRDYTLTDEWAHHIKYPHSRIRLTQPPRAAKDASKTPPSRFQKRKGSIYATPSSRDGHVERNRDAVEEFHKAHSKRWSISSSKSGSSEPQRRKSSAASGANA
ncbi:hypothetical protein O1611_g3058 [Lasiodiplodia mahajangana]|uniref:Uncharacterized protein n=1 Tax=Lasiodiplodia mahajangana TaxID=1108764 RepID=A0ACC2JT34_9PEZI|nr:hypothetical protein O1611_g3058 [Lasiodiplodia mahajangana]